MSQTGIKDRSVYDDPFRYHPALSSVLEIGTLHGTPMHVKMGGVVFGYKIVIRNAMPAFNCEVRRLRGGVVVIQGLRQLGSRRSAADLACGF